MNHSIDFSEIKPKSMDKYLPEGEYECRITKVETKESRRKKTPFWELTWECVEAGRHEGLIAVERKYLTSGTAPYVKWWAKQVLNVQLQGQNIDPRQFKGRFATVSVQPKEAEYDGEKTTIKEVKSHKSQRFFTKNAKTVVGQQDPAHQHRESNVSQTNSEERNETDEPYIGEVPF